MFQNNATPPPNKVPQNCSNLKDYLTLQGVNLHMTSVLVYLNIFIIYGKDPNFKIQWNQY